MDRRLSVNRASSKISKPSTSRPPSSSSSPSPPRPFSGNSSRPPATIVDADPSSFRRVVQELTGTPPPSASSSPARTANDSIVRSSRLQRFAPPPLRQTLAQQPLKATASQQNNYSLHEEHQSHLPQQHVPNHLLYLQRHPQYPQEDIQGMFAQPFSPPLPLTQPANPIPYPNPNFNFSQSLLAYPNASLPMLSPRLLSPLPVLTPGDNTWANPLDAIPSPRPMLNSTNPLSPLLTLPSPRSGQMRANSGNGRSDHEVLERAPSLSLSLPHAGGHSSMPPPLPPGASWHSQSQYPPLLASPMAPSPGFSLLPWSPLASPPPFSPSLFLQSPGAGRPSGGFSFQGPSDYSSKPS